MHHHAQPNPSIILLLTNFRSALVRMCARMRTKACVEVRGRLAEVGSLLSCRCQGSNSVCQAWQSLSVPTELSHWLALLLFIAKSSWVTSIGNLVLSHSRLSHLHIREEPHLSHSELLGHRESSYWGGFGRPLGRVSASLIPGAPHPPRALPLLSSSESWGVPRTQVKDRIW